MTAGSETGRDFISSEGAREKAREAIQASGLLHDRLFAPWSGATLGEPVLVRSLGRDPSYWLIPVIIGGITGGFVRVLGDGRVAHLGVFYRDPGSIEGPPAVTGMEAGEAARRAAERIRPEEGERAAEPVFVHDGPVGREAWLIEVIRNGVAVRWIFITPGFTYERAAGTEREEGYY